MTTRSMYAYNKQNEEALEKLRKKTVILEAISKLKKGDNICINYKAPIEAKCGQITEVEYSHMNDGYTAFSKGEPYWVGDSKRYVENFKMQYVDGRTGPDKLYDYKDDNIKEQIIGIESDEERPWYSTPLAGGKKTFRKKSKKRKTKRNRKTRR